METRIDPSTPCPKVFLSYSWDSEEHKQWVRDLGARLRGAGILLNLDEWEVRPGDQLPHYMERAVRESDFVLCACTQRYKARFDGRTGGAGYEANLMSAEALATGNERKFIALLRGGEPREALPSWLLGKKFFDFRGSPYSEQSYELLVSSLHGLLPEAPPVRPRTLEPDRLAPASLARQDSYADFINAALKVFQATNSRLLLRSRNDEASRILLRGVERELEQHEKRVNDLVQTFSLQSSEEVQKAAGEVAGWVLLSKMSSMHPDLKDKHKEAWEKFLKESLPRFKEATRGEGGLR
jgi:hypothetical protein